VTDARGQSLIARLLQPGENVGLDGTLPMKVTIGNVAGTQVVFRRQP
jgi:cytoskeleton protein RodZ